MESAEQLMIWIKRGQADALAQAIEEQPELMRQVSPMGVSWLQVAAYCRSDEIVALLRPYYEPLSLFEAASIGDLDSVKARLEEQANAINTPAADGFTALGLASFFGQEEVVKHLLGAGANPNIPASNAVGVYPIHSAAAVSQVAIARLLLAAGADPNVKQQKDIMPLHSAAHNGQQELVALLIKYGADTQAKSTDGKNAADFAREAQYHDLLPLLE